VYRKEAILKMLASMLRCEKCNRSISAEGISLLSQKDDWWFFDVHCSGCGESRVVAALVRDEDAPESEAPHEAEMPNVGVCVSSDDVLDMHLFLRDFGGDFQSLLP
jgi:hypothetical protein